MGIVGIGADTELFTDRDKRRCDRTLRMFRRISGRRIKLQWLDVGAGESYMRSVLSDGIDIIDTDIDLDIEPYKFSDGQFNTITSFEVIEHLFNPLFHMREVARVLSYSGNLFLTTPNDYSLIYKAEHLLGRKYRPHFHQFSERDLRDICELAGLEVVSISKFFRSNSGTIARISRNGLFLHAIKKQS